MPDIVDYRVIALADSTRLEGFLAQPLGRRFRPFEAVDARKGYGPEDFDVEGFEDRFGRPPLNGEVGCTLSHMSVLREFASSPGPDTDWLVVAEDDARFSPHAPEVLEALAARGGDRRLVVLAGGTGLMDRRNHHPHSQSENQLQLSVLAPRVLHRDGAPAYRAGRWSRGLVGAAFYMVSRGGARAVITHLDDVCSGRPWWFADYHGVYRDEAGVDVHAVRPILARWDDHGSSIEVEGLDAWRASAEGVGPAPLRDHAAALGHRAMLVMRSTKYDIAWRLRHRRGGAR